MYGLDLMKLLFLLAIILILWFSFTLIIRRWLNVERPKWSSYNHVNGKHKRIDWIIRIAAIFMLIAGYIINMSRDPANWYWFLQPWFILIIFIFAIQIVRAVMEQKYAQNPNAYKVTIGEIIFIFLLFFTLFQTDFFGLV
ncbi:DUF4181 domain-containing protein [Gracilibacillus oryzae]|uniref:DUF4181 domain-containing protein n=1 Tax=Gracilibacillus oryzae TaxID=1672701 RepID=A0A7C8KSY1_9BACI|nr:DUF4181 domain-containing protein [Gracilibacillus oryzae]KAB8130297.1 DUF4181 domain-containing protein [Gracilibacillus oryzae]